MRLLLLACCTLIVSSVAQAQSPQEVREFMYGVCLNNGYTPAFCDCWVHTTLGLLTPEDVAALLRGGTTPHVPYVEQQANARCANAR